MDLRVEIGGLRLEHPVLNGSGTFDAIAARSKGSASSLSRSPVEYFANSGLPADSSLTSPWISASAFQRAAFSFRIMYVRIEPDANAFTSL